MLTGDLPSRMERNETLLLTIKKQLRCIYNHEFIDYDPIARLPLIEDRVDTKLGGIRNSFRSLLHYLE